MVLANGMLADASVKVFDGINLETLHRTFQREMKDIVKDKVELSFQMRREESARKLIVKLQKFRHLEEVLGKKTH